MADYIPNAEADKVVWANDHSAGVSTHGVTVGLSPADIADAANDALILAHAVNGQSLYQSKAQEWTEYKELLLYSPLNTPVPSTPVAPVVGTLPLGAKASLIARARQRAERIKAHPNYTPAIGEDCRIVAPADGPPPDHPTLTAKPETAFNVRIGFAMLGHDQIEIFAKRGAEPDFTLLAVDTNNPYIDARAPLVAGTPELREYRARFRDDDVPSGTWSDVVSVTASP